MMKLNRGDKIYLDKKETKESLVNRFLACRDGVVEVYQYTDASGYGSPVRLFLCEDVKHESVSIIRQTFNGGEWMEEKMNFDSDSFVFLAGLIRGEHDKLGGNYTLVRDFSR